MRASIGLAAAVLLTLGCAAAARAQDELPKDAPPAPRAVQPQKPSAQPPAVTLPDALAPGAMTDQPLAVLQALDKVTARVRRLSIKVGQTASFGLLTVKVDACRKAPPEDPPESAAFLEIREAENAKAAPLFSGWMFASSPALSAMDHPVYDIWVVDCAGDAAETPASR